MISISVAPLFLCNITMHNLSRTCIRLMDSAIPAASTMDQSTQTGANQTCVLHTMILFSRYCSKKKSVSINNLSTKQSTSQLNSRLNGDSPTGSKLKFQLQHFLDIWGNAHIWKHIDQSYLIVRLSEVVQGQDMIQEGAELWGEVFEHEAIVVGLF